MLELLWVPEFSRTQRAGPRRGAGDEKRLQHPSSASWHLGKGRAGSLACVVTAGTAKGTAGSPCSDSTPASAASRDTRFEHLGAG